MTWVHEPPVKAGYYWMRYKGGDDCVVVRVSACCELRRDESNACFMFRGLIVHWHGGGRGTWLDKFDAVQVEAWAPAEPPP